MGTAHQADGGPRGGLSVWCQVAVVSAGMRSRSASQRHTMMSFASDPRPEYALRIASTSLRVNGRSVTSLLSHAPPCTSMWVLTLVASRGDTSRWRRRRSNPARGARKAWSRQSAEAARLLEDRRSRARLLVELTQKRDQASRDRCHLVRGERRPVIAFEAVREGTGSSSDARGVRC